MKHQLIFIALFISFMVKVFSQETATENLLNTHPSWGKEYFEFPLSFAQDIPYQGHEEAYFPKGWGQIESPEFWTYAFVWHIDGIQSFSEQVLEIQLQRYFDGLMTGRYTDNISLFNTTALFLKMPAVAGLDTFTGKLQIYDGFKTKSPMVLYACVYIQQCQEEQRTNVVFKFSPKPFKDAIWDSLNAITLNHKSCEIKSD